MKRLLLLQPVYKTENPAYRSYSPALGILANFLKKDFDITVLDLLVNNLSPDQIDFRPFDLVAMTLLTPAVPSAQEIIRKIKSLPKKIPVVAGGAHATFLPGETLGLGFDYIVTGRTDSGISPIFNAITNGNQDEKIIAGTIKQDEDLGICLDYFDLAKYSEHIFFTSIGCPHKCVFCSNNSFSVHERKLDNLFAEMSSALLRKNMPIFFSDDIFIPQQRRFTQFCERLKKEIKNISFTIQMRVDQVSPKRIEDLAEAGCVRIILGVESGSDASLKLFNKNITQTDIVKAIKIIEGTGLHTRMNYIVGMLGDDMPEINLQRIADKARPSEISIHQLIPFPGSALWNNPEKFGIHIKDRLAFGEYNFSAISENFIYKSFKGRSTEEVIAQCANNLHTCGYREPGTSSEGPFCVTPLSPVRFSH